MPRKAKEPEDKKVHFAKLKRIWEDLAVPDWLMLASELVPEAGFIRSGPHIKGRCPFHDDPKPSFIITPGKGMAKCFGCQKSFLNPVALVAALKGKAEGGNGRSCSFGDALLFLRKRFGLKASIPEALYEKIREHEVHQKAKRALGEFFASQLLAAIGTWPHAVERNYQWAQPALEYLKSRHLGDYALNEPRPASAADEDNPEQFDPHGVWPAICGNQLLGILPPRAVVSNHFGENSDEYKFFCSYFAEYVNEGFTFVGYLVFMYHDEPDSICRFKLRAPSAEKKMFFVGDKYEAEMEGFRGFYGLHYYRTFIGLRAMDDNSSFVDTVVLVEGEFDALSSIARQIRHESHDFVVFALGGSSVPPLDRLTNFGITRARIVQDADKGGDRIAKVCLEKTKTQNLSFSVFVWPDEYVNWRDPSDPDKRIKDPDDAVRLVGYPRWARYINSADTYQPTWEWCFEQASVEISRIEVDDVKQRGRAAAEWGSLLRDSQECSAFCSLVEKHFGLDKAHLYRDIRAKDEDEEGFILRLCDVVKEDFHLVGIQNIEGRRRSMLLWDKEERTTTSVVLNDEKSVETAFCRRYGSLYEFVATRVGDPAFMAAEGQDSVFKVMVRVKKYKEYLNLALLKLSQGLPSIDYAPMKAQGIHYVTGTEEESHSYMVNGRDVYHIVHRPNRPMEVSFLDGPSDNGTIFDNTGDAWITSVKKAEDLYLDVSLAELFRRVKFMIEVGWSFKYQDLDTTFLAAYIMSIAIMTVFTRQTAIMVTAEAESGKSRFTSGLLGGSSFPRINLVAHAIVMNGYTAASIRQQRNNSSLCLCLEEFEDYGLNDNKSLNTRKVLELFRDLISEREVNWSVGTTSGERRVYHLRFPLATCAIRPLRDAASLSRFIAFELVKDPKRMDPVVALIDRFGEAEIQQIRHALVAGLLPHMPRVRKLQAEVEREFAQGGSMPSHVSSRFREAVFPVLAMLKLIHEDAEKRGESTEGLAEYRQFAYAFAESRKDQLSRLKVSSENEQVFESILSSAIQIANSEDNRISWVTTIRVMLADLNKLDDINRTKKGVYIDKQNEWLVVNWIEATQGVLANTKYRNETTTFLKQVSERSPFHVTTDQVRQSRVLDRLVESMGPCQPLDIISVFSVKHLLDAARELRRVAPPQGGTPAAEVPGGAPQTGDKAVSAGSDDDIVA